MATITKLPKNVPLAVLESYGATSISVENNHPDLIVNGDDLGYVRIPEGPKFNINIETDSEGLQRLQKALKEEPRSEGAQLKHDLKTIHSINECEGNGFIEKSENFLAKKEMQANAIYNELERKISMIDDEVEEPVCNNPGARIITRYKLRHR